MGLRFNLSDNIDKSLSQRHGEFTQELESEKASSSAEESAFVAATKRKGLLRNLIVALSFLCIVFGSIVVVKAIFFKGEPVQTASAPPPADLGLDPFFEPDEIGEVAEYIKVQVFDLIEDAEEYVDIDENDPPYSAGDAELDYDINAALSNLDLSAKVETPTPLIPEEDASDVEGVLPSPVVPEDVMKPISRPVKKVKPIHYSVQIDNVTQEELYVINALNKNYDMKTKLTSKRNIIRSEWHVYAEDNSSTIQKGGKNVRYLDKFASEKEALDFASVIFENPVIVLEDVQTSYQDVTLCCAELDRAKKFAMETRFKDKVIYVVKEGS